MNTPFPTHPVAETPELRLKRLRSQSGYRGTKELDGILGPFAALYLDTLTPTELDQYEALLDVQELVLWRWLSGQEEPLAAAQSPILQRLITFTQQAGGVTAA
jgi:antitoxin CptB